MKNMLILFVHGLGATSEGTWGRFKEIIAADEDLSKIADVAFFGFKTRKFRWKLFSGRLQKVSDLAEGLRTEIEERYAGYRAVVLAGHSMGGLVIRHYLLEEVKRQAPLRVTKVVLFAVPNQGSELAALAKLFSLDHAQLQDLSPDSPFLETLNKDWHRTQMDRRVDITYVVAGLDEAVRKQSAEGFWGERNVKLVADKKHSEVVNVSAKQDLSFLILRNAVLGTQTRSSASIADEDSSEFLYEMKVACIGFDGRHDHFIVHDLEFGLATFTVSPTAADALTTLGKGIHEMQAVVVDITRPEKNGVDFSDVRDLRLASYNGPILALSSWVNSAIQLESLKSGVSTVTNDRRVLLAELKKISGHSRQEGALQKPSMP